MERLFRTLFEKIGNGLLVLTAAGQVLDANAKACEFLGYGRSDLIQTGLLGIIVPSQVVDGISLLGRVASSSKGVGNISVVHGEGRVVATEMDMVGLPDGTVVCSLRDGSSEDEASVRQVQAHVMDALSRFSRALAHELNNALTPVMGYAQLSERALAEDDEIRKYLRNINNAADRAAGLTAELLAFAQRQVGNPNIYSPSEVVTSSADVIRVALGENVELHLQIEDDVWLAQLDPTRIQQALVNMAENSRDAMPFGGEFTVGVANAYLDSGYAKTHPGVAGGDYVCVTVSDTGVGMTEDVRAHVFEPLFTTKEPGDGIGLGLSTTYGNVKQNGGHIEVSSRPREGSTFRMYFPQSQPGDRLPSLVGYWGGYIYA